MTDRYRTMQVRVGETTHHSAPRTPVSLQRHGKTNAHVPSVPDAACSSLPWFFTSTLASFAYASPPRPSAFLLRSVVGITRIRSNPLWDEAPVRARFPGNSTGAAAASLLPLQRHGIDRRSMGSPPVATPVLERGVRSPRAHPAGTLPTPVARRGFQRRGLGFLERTCPRSLGWRGPWEVVVVLVAWSTRNEDLRHSARDGTCRALNVVGRAGTRVRESKEVQPKAHATRGMPSTPEGDRKRRTVAQVAAPSVCEEEPVGVRTRRKKVRRSEATRPYGQQKCNPARIAPRKWKPSCVESTR